MKLIETDKNIKYLTFDSFDKLKIVKHCFPTKIGGVSEGCYESLNLGLSRGDDENLVLKNFHLISDAVGFDFSNIVMYKQVHGTKIMHITKDTEKGLLAKNKEEDIDALITNVKGVVLATSHADCVPLYFVDPIKKVIGLAHSGWKGTVLKIGKKTVNEMVEKYGCKNSDIIAGIGPSICSDCFEVDELVFKEFEKAFPNIKEFSVFNSNDNKYNIDMWQINKSMIIEAGVLEENIEITNYCTKCNNDLFYSHRTMGDKRGSHVAFLQLI